MRTRGNCTLRDAADGAIHHGPLRDALRLSVTILAAVACARCGGQVSAGEDPLDAAADAALDSPTVTPDTAPIDSGPPWTDDDFREAFVAARCEHLGRCCSESGAPFDLATCRSDARALLEKTFPRSGPHRTLDDAMAKTCVAQTARITDECGWYRESLVESLGFVETFGGCGAAYRDDRAATGAPCIDGACAPSTLGLALCEDVPKSGAPGPNWTCTVRERLRLGDACGASSGVINAECEHTDGLRCDPTSSTCRSRVALGGACSGDPTGGNSPCVEGAYCTNGGTCVASAPLGGACANTSDAEKWHACVAGTQCDRDSGRCIVPRPILAPCSNDGQCASMVCSGGRCVHLLSTIAGYCTSTSSP